MRRLALALALAATLVPRFAAAQSDAQREARERFDRAVRLAAENDNAAALAEFKRVYELVPNPIVLYDIGLVHAAMNQPALAVEALDKLLAAPGSLSSDRLARAKQVREEQAGRVAQLRVKVNVEGAAIEVDGVEVAKAPLTAPLSLASGRHVVGAVAEGHAPARKEVNLAGRTAGDVSLELAPMVGRLAHLVVKSHLPDASVLVDGAAIGRTPLAASITLSPGAHHVELARAGYVRAGRDVSLGDGATAEVLLELEEDRAAVEAEGGTLALAISQPEALVTVDGRSLGVYLGSLHLAAGPHRLRIERGGFLPYERDVEVKRGTVTRLAIELYPGADTLAALTENARLHRTWGWISIGAGAAVIGGGIAVLAVDAHQRSTYAATYQALESDLGHQRHPCAPTDVAKSCNDKITAAYDGYHGAQTRDALGLVVGGVGLAIVGAGVALLLTGEDPHRYDKRPASDLFATLRRAEPVYLRNGGGLRLGGTF